MSWILTHSATAFDLLKPHVDQVKTTDIAHALSNVCRFNGHCAWHYSVGQHSLLVAVIVEQLGGTRDEVLAGLMHDAAEAYITDLTRPLKLLLVKAAEQRNEAWQEVLADLGAYRDLVALRGLIKHLFPNEQGQGLSALLDVYQQLEERIWLTICAAMHIHPVLPEIVHHADMIALATEKRDLMPFHHAEWECLRGVTPHIDPIPRMQPELVASLFHNHLLELLTTTHRARAVA